MNYKITIKRTTSALKADIIFLIKQGLIIIFFVVAVLYVIILSQLPEKILSYAVPILVFSDPAILGFIFSGAILMLEKEQGITSYLEITPLKFYEYIVSKIIALGLISLLISLLISITSYKGYANYYIISSTIILISTFFTLVGFIVAESCTSINQFLMKAGGLMGLFILPCFSLIGFKFSEIFYLFPSVAALKLLISAYNGISTINALLILLYLITWDIILIIIAKKVHKKRFM